MNEAKPEEQPKPIDVDRARRLVNFLPADDRIVVELFWGIGDHFDKPHSIREIAKIFHHSRREARQWLSSAMQLLAAAIGAPGISEHDLGAALVAGEVRRRADTTDVPTSPALFE